MDLKDLVDRAKSEHEVRPASAPDAIFQDMDDLFIGIPTDVRTFYGLCNGGRFWRDGQSCFDVVSLEAMCGDDYFFLPSGMAENQYAGSFLVICTLDDGDAIGFRKGAFRSTYPVYFLDHECYPDYDFDSSDVVAMSFSDFLERLLECRGETWW